MSLSELNTNETLASILAGATNITQSTKINITPKTSEVLDLQPYEWVSNDRDGGFSIRIWCNTRKTETNNSKRVLLRIEDYEPFCRIELPSIVNGQNIQWNEAALQVYANWLRRALGNDAPTKITYKEMQKIYWYNQGTKYPFFTCYFRTEEAMTHCIRLINKQGYDIKQLGFIRSRVWETSITTIHRLVTDINVGYGQWFRVNAEKVSELDKISTNELEYIASYKNIHALSAEETQGWVTNPLIAALDIECYSTNHRAMPKRDYVDDVVFQISFITQCLGDPNSRQKYLLVLGLCDDIPGTEVIRYDHEISLIDGLCDLIKRLDPTLILGYNIFKFDFPYMDARMKLYMKEWRACGLIKDIGTSINTRTWKSSAYGFMNISTLEAEGRLCIDMFSIIKRDHKLDRYTLDFVSKHFLGRGKHDVSARQMFEIFKECCDAEQSKDKDRIKRAADAMAKVANYCLEDSVLCIDLFEKLNVWIMLIELATIVQVTLMSIFTRGQQIRVQNQVYQIAYRDDFVLDERPGSQDSFAGGAVDDPIPGKYKNLLIFDFASLYPSIIRAFNICYTTLVRPESDIPDEWCNVLAWTEEEETKDPNGKPVTQTKYYRYRFIKKEIFHGILPRMCEHLTHEREKTRKQINPKNDVVTNTVLNQRQLGLKVSNNSIFGSLGVREGRMPLPEGARCITAMGRQLKKMGADHVKQNYGGNAQSIVYGDSVSKDTPVLVKRNGVVEWIKIEDLCHHHRLAIAKTQHNIEHLDYQIWSDQGWTKIKRLIAHKTQKKMYRVLTHTGCVDVTEDHSLLLPDGQEVRPSEVRLGTKLLHHHLPQLPETNTITFEEAWVWGFFYGKGSCAHKSSWALYNTNLQYLNFALQCLSKCEPNYEFKILDTMLSSSVYKLVAKVKDGKHTIVDLVNKYRNLFHYENKHKVVPVQVLHANRQAKMSFIHGYHCANGSKTQGTIRIDNKGKIGTARIFHLLSNLGYNVSINIRKDEIYRLNASINTQPKSSNSIKKIIELPPTNDYVYDIETENHHFGAGIGQMIVHNTDSIFVDLNITDPHQCIQMGNQLADEFKKIFPPPLELTFERALAIGFFIKKKKYAGVPLAIIKLIEGDKIERVDFDNEYKDPNMILYKFNLIRNNKAEIKYIGVPNDILIADIPLNIGDKVTIINVPKDGHTAKYQINNQEYEGKKIVAGIPLDVGGKPNTRELMKKGIVLARRDNCLWIREVYLKVLLSILFDKPLQYTLNIVDEEIIKMMTRQIPFDKMLVTREIGSNYKPNSTYPLKLFADELRRIGHQIEGGERIDYVFVRCQEEWRNEKQGYKMRLPEHFFANCYNEPLDRLHYVEKILCNPVEQILYLGYKNQIDQIERRYTPEKKKRGKIYTYLSRNYINTTVKLIKAKEDLMTTFKAYRPRFNSQEPYFSTTFVEPQPVTLEVVA